MASAADAVSLDGASTKGGGLRVERGCLTRGRGAAPKFGIKLQPGPLVPIDLSDDEKKR